ncbi:EI24 domain-containing protein [Paracoccus aerodenitrificans]|uniref:EI24 domain-containing protein n=1 Tax=Paracoccus aerodenitrificans TaxID=3017781 RepID=UPI0022F027DA|nr:EI24 domain-containing protein [Paracoccus aerodenitrificans]WBU64412.1 EI24 domain-containing protein [Paracoccus aerodenitrificans]
MTSFRALLKGWGDMLRPQIFGLVLRGAALTVLLFIALQAVLFWALRSFTPGSFTLPFWGEITLGPVLSWGSLALFPVLGFFLMAPVAAAFSGLYAERVSARVEALHYASRQGVESDFWDGMLESLAVMGLALLIGIVSLVATPFLGPFAPVLFYGANGWLLGREFFQMAARRHLSDPEATWIRQRNAASATILGIMIAFALTVPLLNIAVPVLAAASFTHLFHLVSGSVGPNQSRLPE